MVDSCSSKGIESNERLLQGAGQRYVLVNINMKVPYNLDKFLTNGGNRDLNITVMVIARMHKISATVYVEYGTENNRKVLHLNSCTLSVEIRYALIGLHAISGKDYVPPFFLKGNKIFWWVACKSVKLIFALRSLGTTFEVDQDLEKTRENFICAIYDKSKLSDVNLVRAAKFWDRYNKERKHQKKGNIKHAKETSKFMPTVPIT